MQSMKIGIIGYGVVGGTTGTVLGKVHEIFPYDKFKEPYCHEDCLKKLAAEAEVVFICVPTPMKRSGEIDLSYIHESLQTLAMALDRLGRDHDDLLVVIRSTAVSGTSDQFAKEFPKFRIAVNPEFLTERNALADMMNTSHVVIGANDDKNFQTLRQVYRSAFIDAEYYWLPRKQAEFVKYSANFMLAGQITLANILKQIADVLDIPWDEINKIILRDPRIGRNTAVPGPDGFHGWGGKCFPKDVAALKELARSLGLDTRLLEAIWEFNLSVREKHDWLEIEGAVSKNEKKVSV